MQRFVLTVLLALSLGVDASAINRTQCLGDLVPQLPSDVVVESFARSASELESASELLMTALATETLVRSDGETIAVRGAIADAVHRAIERMGRAEFAPLVAGLLDAEADVATPEQLEAARTILRIVGNRLDLAAVFVLSERIAQVRVEATNGSRLEAAVAAIVARDTRALDALASLFSRIAPDHRNVCIRAIGKSAGPERRQWLAARCGDDASVDLTILSALAQIDRVALPLEASDLERVREYLESPDLQLRREATRACAALGDMDAVPILVENLDDEFESVRDATRAALFELTHLRLGDAPERWLAWLRSEEDWHDRAAASQLRRLTLRDIRAVQTLLASLATHRLYRDEIAMHVEPLLQHDSPTIRRSACATLQQLESQVGIDSLVDALDDVNDEVVRAAQTALRGITRIAPETQPEQWLALVARD